ncbi:GMC family oxidoreductase N-terminal domain-containing protein [Actinomadura barringtoniae]|uniref:GMC family oxidoreductase N-terminal domain-containing protein n=1 Tax=Actinomadura barringtoniae TaxID=1427535 RepID=A0A939T560_9ACTN|nr:GMC family oxidoreductase [Actinomadura barringtoniae]MBO2453366.1 GMC family oxidoreductase N-terminal domain-containing protein [Actinomadura barringtoniae]
MPDDDVDRRQVLRGLASAGAGALVAGMAAATAFDAGHDPPDGRADEPRPDWIVPDSDPTADRREYDYIVIGSGAGGAPVAANLAERGFQVLVVEAGPGTIAEIPYSVPAFHLFASSDPALSWDFYVRHYTDTAQHGTTWVKERQGVLYPRASTLGGCTAHHAMLTMYPENQDWDDIAALTGDPSWNSFAMRRHFERVRSWLPIEFAPPALLLRDRTVARLVGAAALETGTVTRGLGQGVDLNRFAVAGLDLDPNDAAHVDAFHEGMFMIPQSTRDGRRYSTRTRLLQVAAGHPGRLALQTDALVERVTLDRGHDGTLRATGIELRRGRHLYEASPMSGGHPGERRQVRARREVIVAGGAFNSPQLLMLSGIGPSDHLRSKRVPVALDLPGVGGNLQDRYEISVVSRFDRDFEIVKGATFGHPGDPLLRQWRRGTGFPSYDSNGIIAGIKKRFSRGSAHPELFVFGSPSRFEGYAPGFAAKGVAEPDYFTWAVLRGYTHNDLGTVRLRSADPAAVPDINFRYFGDGRAGDADLDAICEGVELARRINGRATSLRWTDAARATEVFPGPGRTGRDELKAFIRKQAWGHHASCSNPIGSRGSRRAVVDSRFRVHGVQGLRVVDASVFPSIPGLFPVLAVYMIAEKASEDILRDAAVAAGAAGGAAL